jgi:hypothetical protein
MIFDKKVHPQWFEREKLRESAHNALNLDSGWSKESMDSDKL